MQLHRLAVMLVVVISVGCASPSPASKSGTGSAQPGAPAAPKVLTVGISEDPGNFWDAQTGGGGSGVRELGHMVNSYLATTAADGTATPRLLAELPDVSRGTWRLLPDGGMQTTMSLR